MGWGSGTNKDGREVGYMIEAVCDKDGCETKIDRGLAYVCGDMHDGGDYGCGKYFCLEHLVHFSPGAGVHPHSLCEECEKEHTTIVLTKIVGMKLWEAECPVCSEDVFAINQPEIDPDKYILNSNVVNLSWHPNAEFELQPCGHSVYTLLTTERVVEGD